MNQKKSRLRRSMAAVLADSRWKALACGRATPEEIADLRAWAERNRDAAEAWHACNPATQHESTQLADELWRKRTGTKNTSDLEVRPSAKFVLPSATTDRNTIRVFLIDDHPVLRNRLARALNAESGMLVVGGAGTASDALHEIAIAKPDVVLVDLNVPDRDGFELLTALHTFYPSVRLLVLSGYSDAYRVAEALRAGAQGYLVKTAEVSEIIQGSRAVMRGEAPLSPSIASAVVHAMRKPIAEGAGGLDRLTPRERQVLRLLAMGRSTREAAAQLTISPKTVETHRVRIYQKLGCKSTVELTRIAVRAGLIEA